MYKLLNTMAVSVYIFEYNLKKKIWFGWYLWQFGKKLKKL